eukprot:CAMPEP_0177688890 /NCGR_PEP_ID=MMETSP0447-20121125/34885_1 /TAXON_ID=0 /ORGANISM="Stygamoeba regulata, Strain BSH-02190019" /LENGTH=110 /DNA_ID=CAMNT_0019199193 /DNA_START=227 /DNA_END=556 /DNA_ORIENTATION=-
MVLNSQATSVQAGKLKSWRTKQGARAARPFAVSDCNSYVCTGSDSGCLTVYEISTGSLIRTLEHKRSKFATLDIAFSPSMRSIVAVTVIRCTFLNSRGVNRPQHNQSNIY